MAVVLKLFQEEAPLCRVNYFVALQKKTHDENILKRTILLTNFRLYQKQMNLCNAGTTNSVFSLMSLMLNIQNVLVNISITNCYKIVLTVNNNIV